MAKHSYEFKKKIVLEYLNSDEGCTSISRKYGMASSSQLLKWTAAYKAFGDDGLKRSRSRKIYSFKEKLSVVQSYLTSEFSYQELALQVGINNPTMIARWVNEFKIAGPDALRPHRKGRKRTLSKSRTSKPDTQEQKPVVDTSVEHVQELDEPDQNYRQELHQLALQQGNDAVYRLLVICDPEAASRIHPNNLKRVIRALEVFYLTGQSITEHDRLSRTGEPEFKPFWFGLLPEPRDFLYARIDRRVDRMMAEGLLTETEFLLQSGVSPDATAMQAIGYKELVPVLLGSMPLAEAVAQIKQRSRRYAKRQLTWFRRNPDIRWLSYENAAAFSTLPDTAVRLLSEPCAAAPVPPSTFC